MSRLSFLAQCCVILGHFGGNLFSVDQDWWSLPDVFGDYSVRITLRIRDSMQLHSSKVWPRPPAAGSQAGFSMASQMADFWVAELSPGYFTLPKPAKMGNYAQGLREGNFSRLKNLIQINWKKNSTEETRRIRKCQGKMHYLCDCFKRLVTLKPVIYSQHFVLLFPRKTSARTAVKVMYTYGFSYWVYTSP